MTVPPTELPKDGLRARLISTMQAIYQPSQPLTTTAVGRFVRATGGSVTTLGAIRRCGLRGGVGTGVDRVAGGFRYFFDGRSGQLDDTISACRCRSLRTGVVAADRSNLLVEPGARVLGPPKLVGKAELVNCKADQEQQGDEAENPAA